eukprot:COSAG03_NODE_923_length_5297_cov_3.031358_2_plen_1443_part_00
MRQQGQFVRRAFCTFCCAASLLLHGGGATKLVQPALADVDAPAEAFFSATAKARGRDPADDLLVNKSLTLDRSAAELAVTLASAALRALAADPHQQSVAAELARRLLELDDGGHLAEAFARPAVSTALARELRSVCCTSLGKELISTSRTAETTQQACWQQPRGRAASGGSVGGEVARPDGRSLPPDHSVLQASVDGPSVRGTGRSPRSKLVTHRSAVVAVDRTHRPAAAPKFPPTQLQTATHASAEDGVQDGAALIFGFVRDPQGGVGWAALRGWSSGSDPCGGGAAGCVICWEARIQDFPSCSGYARVGYSCVGDYCASAHPQGNPSGCTVAHPGMIVNTATGRCVKPETPLPSCHLPWEGINCANGRVNLVYLLDYPDLRFELQGRELARLNRLSVFGVTDTTMSGTIPSELRELADLQTLALASNPSLSGTIPSELGELTNLQALYLNSNPRLSGTIPSELRELTSLQTLHLDSNPLLSGTIPSELRELTNLHVRLALYNNPSLSGTIPSELGELTKLQELYLYNNPSLSGTIPSELRELTNLQDVVLYSNPSLSGTIPSELGGLTTLQELALYNNPSLSGSVPTLTGSTSLKVLDLHNCSLTGLPASLPESITHLYLNHNPIDARPANLSSLLGSVPALHVLDAGFINSKVQLQYIAGISQGTRVSNPSPCHIGASCAFVLTMYDDYDQPVNQGGLMHNLMLRLGDLSAPMLDNRDGTFAALIPDGWVREVGSYTFEFAHDGQKFRPMMRGPTDLAVAADCLNTADQKGGVCKGLRTVEFLPRECIDGSHTRLDDDNGTTCVCAPGYERNGNSSSCHRDCRHLGERLSHDGGSCECGGRNYNSSTNGILLCSTGGWEVALQSAEFHEAVGIRNEGGACVPCPSECVRCENGIPVLREGWRLNATTDAALRSLLLNATAGRPQFAFSCPYGSTNCPEIKLDPLPANHTDDDLACPGHRSGALCASCVEGFSRRGSRDSVCSRCADVSNYIQTQYGLRPGWFAAVLCAAALLIGGTLYLLWPKVKMLKAEMKTNLRIMLGSAQVLSLMPTVLEMVFPPQPRAALSFASLLVADLKNVMRTECWGWSWYDRWMASVVGVPLLGTITVASYYLSRMVKARRLDAESRREGHVAAAKDALRALAFLAMFLYPSLSAEIFSALHCRALGPSSSWLEADYEVSCKDPRYVRYENAAYILTAVVPVGFPLALLAALVHQWRHSCELWADNEGGDGDDSNAAWSDVTEEQQFAQYHYARVQSLFGFAVEDFRPGCWWFEPVDLLRKLALSGLLQFVHRGTAAQCFCGSAIAFASFGMQQHLWPYREPESNTLKALVDTQLFLAFLVSFILRVFDVPGFLGSEPFSAEMYGLLLLCSMVLLLIAAVALTAMQIVRRQKFRARLLDVDLAGLSSHMYPSEAHGALLDGTGTAQITSRATDARRWPCSL